MTELANNLKVHAPLRLYYRRCRFSVQLPHDRYYTSDHYWMQEETPGIWRVGLTPWEVRLLGDLLKFNLDVAAGATVNLNQPLGLLEGLRAEANIRSVATGTFLHANPILAADLDAISQDCYGTGWLYRISGTPDPDRRDADAYRRWLDETVEAVYGTGPQLQ